MSKMSLPMLPKWHMHHVSEGALFTAQQMRDMRKETARAVQEACAKVCQDMAASAYKRYRAEGNPYDDGGCDMAGTIEAFLKALEFEP